MPGGKPGEQRRGGRKKGTPNKASVARQKAVAASGVTPLDYILSVLRDPDAGSLMRFDAAKAAAPYVHPRLAAIQHSGKIGATDELSDDDLGRLIAALHAFAAGGSREDADG